jgi:CPA1 family monovalent cation:H+ antiporter
MLHLDDSNKRAPIDEKTLQALRNTYRDRLKHVEAGGGESGCPDAVPAHADIVAQLLAVERDKMINLFREGHLKDEPRRRIERDLDLREAELANLNLLDEAKS